MKAKALLALLPAVCLCWPALKIHAQQNPDVAVSTVATGRITGVLTDPTGAVVAGAKVEVTDVASGFRISATTNLAGRFAVDGLSAGSYQFAVTANGFESAFLHDLAVTAGAETTANVALQVATVHAVVKVTPAIEIGAEEQFDVGASDRARSRNTSELVGNMPGVSLRENGELASIPLLHGLGDERTRLIVNGMTVSSSCPNHMNPPLTYLDPAHAARLSVMAGITPVSMGGDSIAGTISAESPEPVFAKPGENIYANGYDSGFFRSNGESYGGSISQWIAGHNLGAGYSGSWVNGKDYRDGSGHKVTSTYAQTTAHAVTLAAQGAGNLFVVQAGLHHTPYEGFVSAQMDLVRNVAESLNLQIRHNFSRGVLDSHLYWQNTWHSMNIGKDKSTFPMPMWMPMNTHGRDLGYSWKFESPLSVRHTLRVGNELHRFVLDDRWPAVPGTAPMMGPDTFVSINGGHRIRLGTFVELASKWNPRWSTLFGLRNDTVWTNAGPVQGYSAMMYGADAAVFNALKRASTDVNLDATGMARYEPNKACTYELGSARKTRSPNLYERYAWSTNMMASGMIGWFGDGNYYVGNVALKPEVANTVSGTATWHDPARKAIQVKLTPYLTYMESYVDVDTLTTATYGMSTFAQLRFANHNARIYGGDLSASGALWNSDTFGHGQVSAVGGWLHGERLDPSAPLYQMMPLNLRVLFNEEFRGFSGGAGMQAVDRKSNVDPHRFEQATPGYALFNLHAGYQRGHLLANAAADNLLNKNYELPLGGVNFDDFMASMWMSQIKPLTGRGRSVTFSLTAQF
jgi:iron complex outermembrane receptor protein